MISPSSSFEEIKFTIVVPTRDRADTLLHCLPTLLAQKYSNYEIFVSDNFSQDATEATVKSFKDKRIRYVNTGRRLGMAQNWEFALSYVADGWVMFVGDDDGLYPWALGTLNKFIKIFQVEAVSSAHGHFRWPRHFEVTPKGLLRFPLTCGAKLKNSRTELVKVFSGKAEYKNLPFLYHGGAASMTLINRLRGGNGNFFCSQIPDLYSAIAISSGTKNYLSIAVPIALDGASKHSTGASLMLSKSTLAAETPITRFSAENKDIPFDPSMIMGKSLQNMLYETYLQSTHIHKGNLNLSLERQLCVAVRTAPDEYFDDILKECYAIAQKNSARFSYSYADKISRRIFNLTRRIKLMSKTISFSPEDFCIDNIFDATNFSASIYSYLMANPIQKHFYLLSIFIYNIFRWLWIRITRI